MKKNILILCSLFVVTAVAIAAMLLFKNSAEEALAYEIDFPVSMDDVGFANAEKVYDLKELKSQIDQETAFVYSNPKKTDYKIVSDFGFDVDKYEDRDDGERFYRDSRYDHLVRPKGIYIDEFGCFSYTTGIQDTEFEMTLTQKECVQIAKEYLKKWNLFSDRLGKGENWSISESGTMTGEGENVRVTSITVSFSPEETDGMDSIGNARAMVKLNGNGEVCGVTYSLREYENTQEVKLVPLEEAVKRFEEEKAFIEMDSPSKKLDFKEVHLEYWSEERNPDNLIMQPVYVFEGTSLTTNGEKEHFAITVQANEVK